MERTYEDIDTIQSVDLVLEVGSYILQSDWLISLSYQGIPVDAHTVKTDRLKLVIKEDKNLPYYEFIEDPCPLRDRLVAHPDIVYLVVKYKDGKEKQINVPWVDDGDDSFAQRTRRTKNHNLVVTISYQNAYANPRCLKNNLTAEFLISGNKYWKTLKHKYEESKKADNSKKI